VFDLIRGYAANVGAVLCAFDLLEVNGEDIRRVPIEDRKRRLAGLLRFPHEGISINEAFSGEGAVIYSHACALGCEGVVSKRLGSLTAPADRDIGSKSRTRVRQPSSANAKSTGRSGDHTPTVAGRVDIPSA
jgi:hypothetical protein